MDIKKYDELKEQAESRCIGTEESFVLQDLTVIMCEIGKTLERINNNLEDIAINTKFIGTHP